MTRKWFKRQTTLVGMLGKGVSTSMLSSRYWRMPFDRGAMHNTSMAIIVIRSIVHRIAIIPHSELARSPAKSAAKVGAHAMAVNLSQ